MNIVTAVLTIIMSAVFLVTLSRMTGEYDNFRDASHGYYELDFSSRELMEASDYLTEQVRLFALTGERDYLDNYFTEAKVTRRRENAIEALEQNGASRDAVEKLSLAMNESVDLMNTEYLSMRLTVLSYGCDIKDFPDEVQAVVIPDDYLRKPSKELHDIACKLVLDEEYCSQKERISGYMNECIRSLFDAMYERQTAAEERMGKKINLIIVLVLGAIVLVFLRVGLSAKFIVIPIRAAENLIREGKDVPGSYIRELNFVAQTYNRILSENRAYTDHLVYEVKHDKLTGAINRIGYEEILNEMDVSRAALLLIDVDRFKGVNDSYGHDMGDFALEIVSQTLTDNFRSADSVCRVGGDEFAVIMQNTGPECKEQIEDKINKINKQLSISQEGVPPLSISVGCAFGLSPNGSGSIVKDADVALYRVKENGRCGCEFFE